MTNLSVLSALGIKGSKGKTHCPSHNDDKASLSVCISETGKILVKCHAGCDQDHVLRDLERVHGITQSDLGNERWEARPVIKREVARYVYRDEKGREVFTKTRFEPKDFVISPSGADTKSHLYNLPQILAAPPVKTVLWVEGEKAADRLMGLGLLATCIGGASKSPDKAVKALRGRRVVILPDNDDAGKMHATTVERCLKASGAQAVRILNLPGLGVKEDVCDWLDSGRTVYELNQLVRRSLGSARASALPVTQAEWMWQPRIPAKGLTMFFGEAGIGKSTMMVDLVSRWTRGDPMPETVGRAFKPATVGMYGFEDDISSVVIPRLMAAGADLDRVVFLELDKTKPVLPNQIARIKQICEEEDVAVLVLDNVENAMGDGINSDNSRSLRSVLSPLNDLGFPVMAIHHPKKGATHGSLKEAMSGSQAYTNVARSVMAIIPTPPEPDGSLLTALAAVKSNYADVRQTRTLYFSVVSRGIDGLGSQTYIEWRGGDATPGEDLYKSLREFREKVSDTAPPPLRISPLPSGDFLSSSEEFKSSSEDIIPSFSKMSSPIEDSKENTDSKDTSPGSGYRPAAANNYQGRAVLSLVTNKVIDPWVEEQRKKLGIGNED